MDYVKKVAEKFNKTTYHVLVMAVYECAEDRDEYPIDTLVNTYNETGEYPEFVKRYCQRKLHGI